MSHITTELADRILTIRFTRQDKKNAVTQDMYLAIATALREAEKNPEVRVVLFAGQPDCFCSGNDIADFLKMPAASTDGPIPQFMLAMTEINKPVLAAASGIAVGIGVTLLLHCDLVYLGEQTKLNMPFINLGICPEFASTYILPRLMGHQRACELLLGEPFDAAKARDYGIANALVPNAEVENVARKKALAIAQLPPNAVRTTKALLRRWSAEVTATAIKVEVDHFMPMLKQAEAGEALQAFMQKRKPDFSRFT